MRAREKKIGKLSKNPKTDKFLDVSGLIESLKCQQKKVELAIKCLRVFEDDGILVQDDKAMIYIYRQIMNGNEQTGFVGCTSIDEVIVLADTDFPTVDAGQNMTIDCNQSEVVLDGSGSIGVEFDYLWTATNGGNIIAIGSAVNSFADKEGFDLKKKNLF